MQQFVVPQFIDVEGKIIGPITTRQFILLLAGGLGIFLAYRFGDFTFFIFATVIITILVVMFAFVKVNSRPFHYFLINIIQTLLIRKMLRVWKREEFMRISTSQLGHTKDTKEKDGENINKKLTTPTELKELALLVDTGGVYKSEEEMPYGLIEQ